MAGVHDPRAGRRLDPVGLDIHGDIGERKAHAIEREEHEERHRREQHRGEGGGDDHAGQEPEDHAAGAKALDNGAGEQEHGERAKGLPHQHQAELGFGQADHQLQVGDAGMDGAGGQGVGEEQRDNAPMGGKHDGPIV